MATIRLTLKGAPENISVRSLAGALGSALQILEDLDLALSHDPKGSLDWVVTKLSTGSISVTMESRSRLRAQNHGPDTAHAFVTGLDKLEREGASPPYLSEYGILKARALVGLIGRDGVSGIHATDLDHNADISRIAFDNIRQITQLKDSAIGSVEGTIETLSIHGKPKFILYESRTRKAVTCRFSRTEWFEKIKESMGKRVMVSGLIHYNMKGEPQRIDLEDVRTLRDRGKLPGIEELSGSDPEFTGDLSTEEYVKLIRNG